MNTDFWCGNMSINNLNKIKIINIWQNIAWLQVH